jgi:hypothetical protein
MAFPRIASLFLFVLPLTACGPLVKPEVPPPQAVVSPVFFGLHSGREPNIAFGSFRFAAKFTNGEWDYIDSDTKIAWAEARGAEPLMVLGVSANVPITSAAWTSYVTEVVTRYQGRVTYYEVWNEPEYAKYFSGTLTDLVRVTNEAATIVHRAGALLVSPSFCGSYRCIAEVTKFLDAGGYAQVDVVAFHFYTHGLPPEAIVEDFSALKESLNRHSISVPIWDTELSWNISTQGENGGFMSDDMQVSYLERAMLVHIFLGIDRLYWYRWDTTSESAIALSARGFPTPAGTAYQEMQEALIGHSVSCGQTGSDWKCTTDAGTRITWSQTSISLPVVFHE